MGKWENGWDAEDMPSHRLLDCPAVQHDRADDKLSNADLESIRRMPPATAECAIWLLTNDVVSMEASIEEVSGLWVTAEQVQMWMRMCRHEVPCDTEMGTRPPLHLIFAYSTVTQGDHPVLQQHYAS